MKWGLMLIGWVLANSSPARLGVVETRDGHVYEGHIRFDSNLLVIANAANNILASVDVTNLTQMTFPKELAAPDNEVAPPESMWPGPWQNEDVGSVRLPGSVICAAGLFRLNSSGTNIFGQSDAFHFVFKPISGDSELVARVLQVQFSAPWAKAGVMMRESLRADSPNVALVLTPLRMGVFAWRETGGDTTHSEVERGILIPHWIKLRREGNTFTASESRNGRQWRSAGRVTVSMKDDIFVGLAVTGVDEGASRPKRPSINRSMFDSVREAPFLVNDFTPVIQLQNGSRAVGRISLADEWQVQIAGAPPALPIPTASVARLLFQWLPYGWTRKVNSGQPGVLLTSGEFIEGGFKGIEKGRVRISSVLLGWRSFDLNNEVAAVVLRKLSVTPQQYEVKTLDGSVWFGSALQIEKEQILLHEKSLGTRRIAVHELLEVNRRAKTG